MNIFHEGKIIGSLDNGVFKKVVKKSKHYMKILDAYGISLDVIEKLEEKCEYVNIFDMESKELWTVPYDRFKEYAFIKGFGGYEKQMFLTKRYWDIWDEGKNLIQKGEVKVGATPLRGVA